MQSQALTVMSVGLGSAVLAAGIAASFSVWVALMALVLLWALAICWHSNIEGDVVARSVPKNLLERQINGFLASKGHGHLYFSEALNKVPLRLFGPGVAGGLVTIIFIAIVGAGPVYALSVAPVDPILATVWVPAQFVVSGLAGAAVLLVTGIGLGTRKRVARSIDQDQLS